MSTAARQSTATSHRLASREELTRFYRAIGIPAVASAVLATKMALVPTRKHRPASASHQD
jgi:hypothetical protein